MENIMRKNRIHPPLPRSYQLRTRHALAELDGMFYQCPEGHDRQAKKVFIQTKETLDVLAWKADKQAQVFESRIEWLEKIVKGYEMSL